MYGIRKYFIFILHQFPKSICKCWLVCLPWIFKEIDNQRVLLDKCKAHTYAGSSFNPFIAITLKEELWINLHTLIINLNCCFWCQSDCFFLSLKGDIITLFPTIDLRINCPTSLASSTLTELVAMHTEIPMESINLYGLGLYRTASYGYTRHCKSKRLTCGL